ncbi:MAG: recombinase family protein [Myxococcota bacterium]|jgi:site-specific DNA recombinase|nr:recombinase family protein [Myxococcota bacterium]
MSTRPEPPPPRLRCAIYTRKSTSENLSMDFNTLDAQREAAELYIRGQGWIVLPDRYDDGGYTGANMERPALQRLLEDIDAGKLDCIVVYKVDRLSRSLLDFAKMIEVFDAKGIHFVSTTQQFNTAQSLGRLVLNLLLSFAQFEREMISERTRDKMSAARRRGKWTGGPPILGYTVDREHRRLELVPEEAEQVRLIFQLYLRLRSIDAVAEKLRSLGWCKKTYAKKNGQPSGGKPWDPNTVHRMLRNPTYVGKVIFKGETYAGEHEAIVDEAIFQQVQDMLSSKSCGRGPRRQRNPDYLLSGLLFCRCGAPMTTTSARGRHGVEYRYYVCKTQMFGGPKVCDHPRLSAAEIEPLVVQRIRTVCADPALRREITARLDDGKDTVGRQLAAQRAEIQRQMDVLNQDGRTLLDTVRAAGGRGSSIAATQLGEIELQLDRLRGQASQVDDQLRGLSTAVGRVSTALELLDSFEELWTHLVPEERLDVTRLLVRRIDVDEPAGIMKMTMHDLADPLPDRPGSQQADSAAAPATTEVAAP